MDRGDPTGEPLTHSWSGDTARPVEETAPTPWSVARDCLAGASTYWLATARRDGAPHAVPVLGVMVDEAVHFCASAHSRKARNLAEDPRCVVNATGSTMDLAVEGRAAVVDEAGALSQVAEAYREKYGWHPTVRDGALWADGAPTAGPPPYQVYRVEPETVFGFPTEDQVVPTRWRF